MAVGRLPDAGADIAEAACRFGARVDRLKQEGGNLGDQAGSRNEPIDDLSPPGRRSVARGRFAAFGRRMVYSGVGRVLPRRADAARARKRVQTTGGERQCRIDSPCISTERW